LRKNGLRWMESSKEEMVTLYQVLKDSHDHNTTRSAVLRFIKKMELEITDGRFFGNTSFNFSDDLTKTMIDWLRNQLPKFNNKGKLVRDENEEIKKMSLRLNKITTLKNKLN